MLVDVIVVTRLERDLLHDFANKIRDHDAVSVFKSFRPGLLARDLHGLWQFFWIVRRDLGTDAVLERRDDLSARGVVFRVRRKHEHHVERETHRITLNLDVALLHDVEERDLDLSGEVGQLVDGEYAPIRTW